MSLLIALCSVLSNIIYAQEEKNELTVIVKDIRNDKGLVGIQLINKEETVIESRYIPILDKSASTVFHRISPGKYAIRIFHDENMNDDMDFNWLRIPKEGFAFSGEKKGTFGAPDFKDMLIQINKDTEITIKMIYIF